MTCGCRSEGELFNFYSEFDNEEEWTNESEAWQQEVSGKNLDRYVLWLQHSLNKIVKLRVPLVEDGDFGTSTRNALGMFRRQAGLKSTGDIVCPDTENKLVAAAANPSPGTLVVRPAETTPPSLTLYVDIPLQVPLGSAKAMTGIFVPENYCPQSQVDLIVFLHGNKVRVHKPHFSIDSFWSLPTFRLREEVNKSQKNVILVAPTLGPFNEPGSLVCSGSFDRFLDQVMFSLKQFGPYGGKNKPTIGNIILACHSGSGGVMRNIATGTDIAATKIRECWAFEPSGSIGSANQWKTWVQSRTGSKLYVYFLSGNAGQALCDDMDRRLRGSDVGCTLVDRKLISHDEVPMRFLKDRLQAAGFLALKSSCTARPTPTPGKTSFLPNRWPFGTMPLSFSREFDEPQEFWNNEGEVWREEYNARLGRNPVAFGRPEEMEFETAQSSKRKSPRTGCGGWGSPAAMVTRPSPFQHESNFEYEKPATVRTARQIFASQPKVRAAVDANFSSIFSDRNKVVVIAFWADSCAPCAEAATAMTVVADRYSKGLAGLVKFYHVQWDPRVNPRVHQQFGFRSVPVVFFYYTSTGRPPSRAAPLLEGSLGHDEKHDPNRYVRTIEAILRRHAPAKVQSASERRGWKRSTDLVSIPGS